MREKLTNLVWKSLLMIKTMKYDIGYEYNLYSKNKNTDLCYNNDFILI